MSDTPKLDFEERQKTQQVYEECCENPEDFAYNFVALQRELAAAQTEIVRLRDAQIITVRSPDGGPCAAPCAIDGCQYERIAELERSEAELAGRVVGLELSLGMSERERDRAQGRVEELERERDGGVGYGLTPDDLDRPPYNLERKDRK